ncbi:hypothetical protein JTE90_013998, partial [Oedothorax gibbosus]
MLRTGTNHREKIKVGKKYKAIKDVL